MRKWRALDEQKPINQILLFCISKHISDSVVSPITIPYEIKWVTLWAQITAKYCNEISKDWLARNEEKRFCFIIEKFVKQQAATTRTPIKPKRVPKCKEMEEKTCWQNALIYRRHVPPNKFQFSEFFLWKLVFTLFSEFTPISIPIYRIDRLTHASMGDENLKQRPLPTDPINSVHWVNHVYATMAANDVEDVVIDYDSPLRTD